MRATHLEMVDAVVGGRGLPAIAAIASRVTGADVAIAAPRMGPPAVSDSAVDESTLTALTRYVTSRLNARPVPIPEPIVNAVPIVARDECVGFVALLSEPKRTTVAESTEVLHLAATATLTMNAIEDARHEVEEGLRDTFLEELRSQSPLTAADTVRRARRLGCDIARGAVVLCADVDRDRPRRMMAIITAEMPEALSQALDGRIYAVVPATDADDPEASTVARAEGIATRLGAHGHVGVSSFYRDPPSCAPPWRRRS